MSVSSSSPFPSPAAGRRGNRAGVPQVVLAFGVLLAVGSFPGEYPRSVLTLWMIYSLSAIGLNVVLGFGKIYSLGHGGFMLVGAYGTAIAIGRWGLPVPLALALAGVVATGVGVVVGLPALRLKHFSLAIVTFAFGITLFQLVKSTPYTGGPQGLFLELTWLQSMWQGRVMFYAATLLCLVGLGMSYSVMSSRSGRALRMIAANETVARSFGIRITFHKLAAFAMAALLGAVSGGLHALVTGVVAPETFGPDLSILIFAAVMIGGQGLLLGPLLGAAFVVAIPELTQDARALSQIIYAVLFLFVVTLFPNGLTGMLAAVWRRLRGRDGTRHDTRGNAV
ncbi:MAG: branched-chain amino acid transport system / permease component family protein [Rhodoferax sp.]|nr:branched-chain amino acid transport system / permease component family protein [Rhodoferax sp.]